MCFRVYIKLQIRVLFKVSITKNRSVEVVSAKLLKYATSRIFANSLFLFIIDLDHDE